MSTDLAHLKRAAARAAVAAEVRSGMRLGLGSGSTVRYVLEAIGQALRDNRLSDLIGVPTSEETARLARELGIPLAALHEAGELDVALDGADEIDPDLNLIKGLGGALLREKMVAQATRRLVIVADASKRVERLGSQSPLPIEVVPFGWQSHLPFLAHFGATATQRQRDGQPFLTDNGNYILDGDFGAAGIGEPQHLEWLLLARAGIVEHGLFLQMAAAAYIASADGVMTITRGGTQVR